MATFTLKPGALHQVRPAIQPARIVSGKRPLTISEALARKGQMARLPQSKAGQA